MRQVVVSRGQRHQVLVSADQQRRPVGTVRGTPRAHSFRRYDLRGPA